MKKSFLTLAAAFALSLGASAVNAANVYVFQWDDSEPVLTGNTYKNGALIQSIAVGNEVYTGSYGLWGDVLAKDVDVRVNILEPFACRIKCKIEISDTWHIFGKAGSGSIGIPFASDVDGKSLDRLADARSLFETGGWQTVLETTATNGDTFTWQFRSGVPEPSTWAMLLIGFGGLGLMYGRTRKRSTAMTAA